MVSEKAAEKSEHSALSFRHFVLGAIAIFLYVGVEVGYSDVYQPLYGQEVRQKVVWASTQRLRVL